MNKKIVLIGLVGLCTALPAIADPVEATWPSSGLMQANKIYTGAATEPNLGKTEGIVLAYPNYTIDPGYYMPGGTYTAAACQSGYYCPGGRIDTVSSFDQLRMGCPSGFTTSEASSKYIVDCYRSCVAADKLGAHASTVGSGKVYYGSATGTNAAGINACGIGTCESGFTKQTVTLNFSDTTEFDSANYNWSPYREALPSPVQGQSSAAYEFDNAFPQSASNKDAYPRWAFQTKTNKDIYFGDALVSSSTDAVLPLNATSGGDKCYCSLKGAFKNFEGYTAVRLYINTPFIYSGMTTSTAGGDTYCYKQCASFFSGDFHNLSSGSTGVHNLINKYAGTINWCKGNTYTLTLDPNGGTLPSNANSSVSWTYTGSGGSAMPTIVTTAKPGLPSRSQMIFDGYYDAKSGGTRYYGRNGVQELNVTFGNEPGNITLYAQWIAEITVKWYGVASSAGGTGNNGYFESAVEFGTDIITPEAAMSATGQRFLGWKFQK